MLLAPEDTSPARARPAPRTPLEVAAAHATRDVPIAHRSELAGDVRRRMLGHRYECAEDVAVLEEDKFCGVVPIERLLAADPSAALATLMDSDPPVVGPHADQELVAAKAVEQSEAAVAVVDADGRFHGLVPPHRMLAVLLTEHDEDLARIGGYLTSTRRARSAAEERVTRRLLHRLPWLMLGLIGAVASAGIVAAFEHQLDARVLLAFFMPGVVYMADAVGRQTETVLIRGFSVGASMRSFVRRELITGVVLGLAIGGAYFLFPLGGWGEADVAAAVAVAVAASCSVATVSAMALPWLFQRVGADPAFGSGPLATVIQDLLSIAIYLVVATSIAA